jgi:uncharacterized membrane protein affecting hemolysin expression
MNLEINLTQIILAVITLLFGLLMRYVVPNLKNNLNDNQLELLRLAVKTAVYAAEQLYNSDQGQEKLKYVIKLLADQGYILDVDNVTAEMRAMIEAFVRELHIEQEKLTAEEAK